MGPGALWWAKTKSYACLFETTLSSGCNNEGMAWGVHYISTRRGTGGGLLSKMALYDEKPHRLAFSDIRHVTVDNQDFVLGMRDDLVQIIQGSLEGPPLEHLTRHFHV